uniref:Uncharacterized protein n=1 Tax=Setaria italica TaxID=4555 RepID=K4A457_SETIT
MLSSLFFFSIWYRTCILFSQNGARKSIVLASFASLDEVGITKGFVYLAFLQLQL